MKGKRKNGNRGRSAGYGQKNREGRPYGANDRKGCDERPDGRDGYKGGSLNDLSWYSRNPLLLQSSAMLPYPNRPGMPVSLANGVQAGSLRTGNMYIPGVLALNWVPSFGRSNYPTDPASIAGKEFYGRVRAAFSGSLDADAPDYVVYIGALDSIFTYLGWLKRVYRALTSYTPDNFMLPDGILQASGFNTTQAEQLRQNKTKLWQYINELILMSRKFKCPAVMDLFNRHYWMSDNIYADADSASSQLYMFCLQGVYKLTQLKEAATEEMVAGLQMNALPTLTMKASDDPVEVLYQFGLGLIQALDAWDDAYTISGYLQRAFQDAPTFAVAELLQSELLTASYVPEVLAQIENSRTCFMPDWPSMSDSDRATALSALQVTQRVSDNSVVTANALTTSGSVTGSVLTILPNMVSHFLSQRSSLPTVADNVIASRLHIITEPTTQTASPYTFNFTCGTELLLDYALIEVSSMWKSLWTMHFQSVIILDSKIGTTAFNTQNVIPVMTMSQFDWHPLCVVASNQTNSPITVFGDVHNITNITKDVLSDMHRVCLYSELNSFQI